MGGDLTMSIPPNNYVGLLRRIIPSPSQLECQTGRKCEGLLSDHYASSCRPTDIKRQRQATVVYGCQSKTQSTENGILHSRRSLEVGSENSAVNDGRRLRVSTHYACTRAVNTGSVYRFLRFVYNT